MNYYMDTEFLEGTQEKRMFGIKYGQTKPTIDLISIALVAEDGREYYAISKDFNLKEAWNRYDIKKEWYSIDNSNQSTRDVKEYWIRENVLGPIWEEWKFNHNGKIVRLGLPIPLNEMKFTYKNFRKLINKYGKTNKQIAEEIKDFISEKHKLDTGIIDQYGFTYNALKTFEGRMKCVEVNWGLPQFYGYYSAYDHVAICWLFGKMIDLPKGFPWYCYDLKQLLDETQLNKFGDSKFTDGRLLNDIKELPSYPKQTNSHNALADARWNKQLHEFLNTL